MRNAKVHIAGRLDGSIQKCMRCHTRLDSNERWPDTTPVGWKHGVAVLSDRNGMTTLTVEEELSGDYRPCGRQVSR